MEKRKQQVYLAGSIAVLVMLAMVFIGVTAAEMTASASETQVDRIVINTLSEYGDLELPAVSFFHSKHTKALAEENKDCKACHQEKDGSLVLLFNRADNAAEAGIKDLYHDGCISCHKEFLAQGKKSGPIESQCRACHQVDGEEIAAEADMRKPAGFENVLHWRHWSSKLIAVSGEKDNCAACHHQYDPATKALVYEKGKEGSCRFCHEGQAYFDQELQVEVRSLKDAAHQDCVTCHQALAVKNEKAGPVDCAGCHSEEGVLVIEQNNAKALKELGGEETSLPPSLPMKRPEAALILPDLPTDLPADAKVFAMAPVAFDHKTHEAANKDCRTCHHKSVEACSNCHTTKGDEKGDFVTLEAAMHSLQSADGDGQSCLSCHRELQQAKECAGCHQQMNQAARPSDASCAACHQALPEGLDLPLAAKLTDEQQAGLAVQMIAARTPVKPVALEDIPETVEIGIISDAYKPALFPHRKIVKALMEPLADNRMAQAFHQDPATLCQGCHHNAPATVEPPKCASCHGKPFAEANPGRPGLKAAYHGQCMSCHKAMGIEELEKGDAKLPATSCVVCHDEKK